MSGCKHDSLDFDTASTAWPLHLLQGSKRRWREAEMLYLEDLQFATVESFQCLGQKEIKQLLQLKPESNKQKWNQPNKNPKSCCCCLKKKNTSKLSNEMWWFKEVWARHFDAAYFANFSPFSSFLPLDLCYFLPCSLIFPLHPHSSSTSLPLFPADFYPSVSMSKIFSVKEGKFIPGIGSLEKWNGNACRPFWESSMIWI